MSAALRLTDVSIWPSFTSASLRSSLRPSLLPTLVPSPRATVIPNLTGSFATEPPSTQRSATVYPRHETASRQEATNLLCVMRLNLDLLQSLLLGQSFGARRDRARRPQRDDRSARAAPRRDRAAAESRTSALTPGSLQTPAGVEAN